MPNHGTITGFLWLVVGLFISVVYTPLAGGGYEHFWLTVFYGPPILVVIFFFAGMRRSREPEVASLFWSAVLWVCLPIALNLTSLLANTLGFPSLAGWLFAARYWSLLASLVLLIVAGAIHEYIIARFNEKLRNIFT